MGTGRRSIVLDAADSTEYDTTALGRVKDPVILPDFKNDPGRIRLRWILPCWIVSSLFFLRLPILMV